MEFSFSSPLSSHSVSAVFPSKSPRRFSSPHLRQLVRFHPSRCQKMFVPGNHIDNQPPSPFFGHRSFSNSPLSSPSLTPPLRSIPPSSCACFIGFGEASPEAKAASNLHHFFTFVAIKIVLAQLQSYNREAYEELMEFVSHNSLNDGDQFCRRLMRESPRRKDLALRIMEVRSAYSKRDFEWDNLQKLAYKMVDESNTRLMRDYVLETSHIEDK